MNFKIETFREKIPSGPQGRKAGVHLRADYVVTSSVKGPLASFSLSLRWFYRFSPQMTCLLLFPWESFLSLIPLRNCSQEEALATHGRGTSFQTSRLQDCCLYFAFRDNTYFWHSFIGLSGPPTNQNCFLPLCGGRGGFEDIFSLSWKLILIFVNKYI